MKVKIEASSQEEFEAKKHKIVKALTGQVAGESREPKFKAQKEMFEYWNKRFQQTINEIKRDVDEVIGQE